MGDYLSGILAGFILCPLVGVAMGALWVWSSGRREKKNILGTVISPNREMQVISWQTEKRTRKGPEKGLIHVGITTPGGKVPDDPVFTLEEVAGERPIIEPHWISDSDLLITFAGSGKVEINPRWSPKEDEPPAVRIRVEQIELDALQSPVQNAEPAPAAEIQIVE